MRLNDLKYLFRLSAKFLNIIHPLKKSYKQISKTLRGIVRKSNKSRGFYVEDSKYDSQFKLGKKELFKAMPGDLVQFSLTQKGWAKIDEVITENTSEFIGKIFRRGKRLYTSPMGYENDLRVLIKEPHPKLIKDGGIGKFLMHKQPSLEALPEANLISLFDLDNEFSLAYEVAVTNHNLKREWPKAVINESRKLKDKNFDIESVKDLRSKTFVTIDGKSAKDFDDAVLGEFIRSNSRCCTLCR